MQVVLDSNIFFSSLISNAGPPHAIVEAWLCGSYELVTSQQQIGEIQRVSRYPKFRINLPAMK